MNCCTIESETAADLMTLRAQLKTSEEAREKLRQRISELDDEIRAWGEKGRGGLIDLWRDQSIKNLKRAEAADHELLKLGIQLTAVAQNRDQLAEGQIVMLNQISDLKQEVDSMQGWYREAAKNLKRAEAAECERDHLGKATQDLHEQISDLKAEVDSMQGYIDHVDGATILDKNALRDANEKIARLLSYEEHDKAWERLVDEREERILFLERLLSGSLDPRIAKALALARSAALSLQAPLAPASAQLLVDQLICVLQGEDQ